jgi:hypothetical protein
MNTEPVARTLRYLPFHKQDVVNMCLMRADMAPHADPFRQLCKMVGNIFHYEFHQITEELKRAYSSLDPDSNTREVLTAEENSSGQLISLLGELLDKGNYERVTQEDLATALKESSLFKIRLHVDFEDFEEVLLFSRGESVRKEVVPRFLGRFPKEISFTHYDRVVIYLKFRSDLGEQAKVLPGARPGATILKLFQNVPKADLEMLFPNTRVRMRTVDKVLIGLPALVSGGIVLTTKVGASLVLLGSLLGFWAGLSSQPVALNGASWLIVLTGLAALGGYVWKQISSFRNRRLMFVQSLTQNLYFKNLDNNAGVFHRLVDDAEEEECKEAFMAYCFLLTAKNPMSPDDLDHQIEQWLAQEWDCVVDFEIKDALRKLEELQLVTSQDGMLSVTPLPQALHLLDQRWDSYFTF